MKRVHVLEFEDLPWFPGWLRDDMRNVITVFSRVAGVPSILAHHVGTVLEQQEILDVIDLGSGSGGVMPEVLAEVRKTPALRDARLTLTDLYPNPDAIEHFESAHPGVTYRAEPVDATDLATAPPGLKTMCNAFHHMRPAQAQKILESAQRTRQPLLVYELANRTMPFPVWLLFLPLGLSLVFLMCMGLTAFVRPLSLRQVFFTYVIPLIPLFYAWDGQASYPRTYSFDDLDELLAGLRTDGYRWEMGKAADPNGKGMGMYLLGVPE